MNKNTIKFSFLLLLCLSFSTPAYSQDNENEALADKLSRIGFIRAISMTPQQEIQEFFVKNVNFSNNHSLEKLKNLYSDNYMSSDGFDKATYFKMIEKTWESYPNVDYSVEIREISINRDYAAVYLNEKATGTTKESYENIKEKGKIDSGSYTIYYLQKFGKDWKITSSRILQETTALRYGDAKNMSIELNAPSQVKAGDTYTAAMDISVPSGTFIIASLSNEPIIYPQGQPKDVFRNVKKNGILERVFTANNDGRNEFAVASVGVTKAAVVDSQNISINITGMAFIMTRVNVLHISNNTSGATDLTNGKN